MTDPLEAMQKLLTCPFCAIKFTNVVKLIPDCGNSICGECYQGLRENVDDSREFKCRACSEVHLLADSELKDCKPILNLLGVQTEKPLAPQAKKLQLAIESVKEELGRLQGFNATEFFNQHCDELEVQVADAAESAVKHIKEIERDLLNRINENRRQHLNNLTPTLAQGQPLQSTIETTQQELDALSQEISSFSNKWKQYFTRLSVLASDSEIEAALVRADAYRASISDVDQKLRSSALEGSIVQFNPKVSFHTVTDHLGELVQQPYLVRRFSNRFIAWPPS